MSAKLTANNFDLLRLFAALQVAILHVSRSVSPQYDQSWWVNFLEIYSGVPIFFFISGFLISRAFERSTSVADYAVNRALRIFPALHVCVFLNILAIALTGYYATTHTTLLELLALYAAKTTFLQFYNPQFMRHFGDGVLNGSLWTICVELQFYLLTPIIYHCAVSSNRRRTNLLLLALLILSVLCNRWLYDSRASIGPSVEWKLARVTFAPWIYMFIAGLLAQRNFDFIRPLLTNKLFWLLLLAYTSYALALHAFGSPMDNSFSPALFFPLAALVLAAAYYPSRTASSLLNGNDVSYGIYIYHVPVMNMFLYFGCQASLLVTSCIVLIATAIATASWFCIERPALRHKRHPSHAIVSRPSNRS